MGLCSLAAFLTAIRCLTVSSPVASDADHPNHCHTGHCDRLSTLTFFIHYAVVPLSRSRIFVPDALTIQGWDAGLTLDLRVYDSLRKQVEAKQH
ncbi:hypothetical protein NEOLEDRAFT_1140721 [Neolentinus lepideus HHB14362 ss-1]|uniref:Secreted protein n=1 Tax=Neolentinus lepideus HHB14362 ss-1 TaxID=1314782 RepID=A0A165P2P8_9AGAM|nr:hypothetical protein NEOLEDRAFT_1140721 [Neolentinus lepideus HHB14362 ss-1]